MPRLSTIETPALLALIDQLRFSGHGAILRQIDRIEILAGELDPTFAYPLHFIMQRITSYRADAPATGPLAAIVPGDALFADLSALVEHLCAQIHLSEADLPLGCVNIEALAQRWRVTRRTIERYRRRGLIARRVHDEQHQVRLAFTPAAVSAFEANHAALLHDAARFTKITPEEARTLRARALRYQQKLGWSSTMIAGRLAAKFNRSRSAVRQVILRPPDPAAARDEPMLAVRPQLSDAQRSDLLSAWDQGERTSTIAKRFNIAATSVSRLVAERQVRAMQASLRAWAEALPAPADGQHPGPLPAATHGLTLETAPTWPSDLSALLAAAERARPLPPSVERACCAAALSVPKQTLAAIDALRGRSPTLTQADAWATSLRCALAQRRAVALSLLGVALRACNERLSQPMEELPPAHAIEAYRAMIATVSDALDRFALGYGQRAAGQVTQHIARQLAAAPRAVEPRPLARARSLTRLPDGDALLAPWSAPLGLPGPLREQLIGQLDGRSPAPEGVEPAMARAIAKRFGLSGSQPGTIAETAAGLGVTSRAVLEAERRLRAHAAAAAVSGAVPSAISVDVSN